MGIGRVFVVLVGLTASAAAEPTAKQLFEEGRELNKQEKWAEACDKLTASLALDPAPGTKLNLGECLEKQGKVRSGWLMYEEAARDFDRANDPRAKFAHDRAAAASAKLATLVIKVADASRPGLAIRIADRAATPQPEIVERVDPGDVTVAVTAPNKRPFTTTIATTAGKTAVVDVPALGDPAVHEERGPQPADQPGDDRRHTRVLIAIGLGITGGAALIGSGILGLMANSQYDDAFSSGECFETPQGNLCTTKGLSEVSSAGTKADIGTGFAIAGGALAAAAIIVYFTAPKEGVTVTPVASSSSVGASLQLSF